VLITPSDIIEQVTQAIPTGPNMALLRKEQVDVERPAQALRDGERLATQLTRHVKDGDYPTLRWPDPELGDLTRPEATRILNDAGWDIQWGIELDWHGDQLDVVASTPRLGKTLAFWREPWWAMPLRWVLGTVWGAGVFAAMVALSSSLGILTAFAAAFGGLVVGLAGFAAGYFFNRAAVRAALTRRVQRSLPQGWQAYNGTIYFAGPDQGTKPSPHTYSVVHDGQYLHDGWLDDTVGDHWDHWDWECAIGGTLGWRAQMDATDWYNMWNRTPGKEDT